MFNLYLKVESTFGDYNKRMNLNNQSKDILWDQMNLYQKLHLLII
jgi:hypothetical protein